LIELQHTLMSNMPLNMYVCTAHVFKLNKTLTPLPPPDDTNLGSYCAHWCAVTKQLGTGCRISSFSSI